MSGGWLIVENWNEFQHYKDRDPKFIKSWCKLLNKDEYLLLTYHQRGILHGLWMAYATANGQLRDSTATLKRHLGHRVLTRDIEALNHAGFITYSDTKPSPLRTPRERERVRGVNKTPKSGEPSGAFLAIATMIANGAITDYVVLDAELRAQNRYLVEEERARLRQALLEFNPIRDADTVEPPEAA